jgi:glutaredoxin-like protein
MTLLGPREKTYVQQQLAGLPRGVTLVLFSDGVAEGSQALATLVNELAEAVPDLRVRMEAPTGPEAERFGTDGRSPALALVPDGSGDGPANGIRFFGFPGGYEFNSLLDAIRRVAGADPGLDGELLAELVGRQEPLHLQVFVTQGCPHCPRMVQMAHHMALASPLVRADMVDAVEFPRLASLYDVQGVPLTVINGRPAITGAAPERRMLAELRGGRG